MLSPTSFRRLMLAMIASLVALLVFMPVSVVAIQAAIAQQSTNTNSEEETEDHSKEEQSRVVRQERIRPPPRNPAPSVVAEIHAAPRVVAPSLVPPPHPSQLSVRRLL